MGLLTMRRVRRVCVIGAGLSGLACALAAADAGRQVDVYEAATERVDTVAHVDLGPAAMREVAALGLGEASVRAGFAYQGLDIVNARGERLFEGATPRLAGPRLPAAIGIGEAGLLAVIEEAARQSGARLHPGVRVEAERRSGSEALHFSEDAIEAADLVVVATGIDSPLQRTLFPTARVVEDVDGHWWQALLPRPLTLHRVTWVLGTDHRKLVLLPVGVAQAGVATVRPAAALEECRGGLSRGASLRSAIAFAARVLPSLESRLDDAAAVSVRPIRASLLPPPWHAGRVLCVGECAHALPPHFGQATAQSLADAVVLGELLRENAGRDDLPAAFTARRASRAARVHPLVSQAARWARRPVAATDLLALAAELDAIVAAPG